MLTNITDRQLTLSKIIVLPFIIVSLSSCFYVYEFFLRVMPSVITDELMTEFQVSAGLMSVMTASFLYAYAIMQLPSGILCDRFGPRKVLTCAVLICAISTLVFQTTTNFYFAILSRLAIGASAACAFIAPLTLTAHWFSPKRFALVAGLVQLMGCIGAMVGGEPIAMLTQSLGWRATLFYAALVGFFLSIIMWLVIRDSPSHIKHDSNHHVEINSEWQRLKTVLKTRQIWYIGFFAFSCWAPIGALAELWGVSYLTQLETISISHAAGKIAIMWIAIAIGSPLIGWWSNYIHSRKIPLISCALLAMTSSTLLIYGHISNPILINTLLFLLGFSASSQPITFALISDIMPKNVVATAVGFNNMCCVAGACICQPLIGFLLDLSKKIYPTTLSTHYHLIHFKFAFIIIPFVAFLGLMISFQRIKETHCKYEPSHASS
ncbi:MAG TPA: MFS transporter [Gammaproteobacteria bacterium]|nr:MFS transporter [Gammaproteobacteria bacterium]